MILRLGTRRAEPGIPGDGADNPSEDSIIPFMTSSTQPTGYVASAASTYSTFQPYKAFDNSSESWRANTDTSIATWLKIKIPASTAVNKYGLRVSDATWSMRSWELQARVTGGNLVSLHVGSDTVDWTPDQMYWFTFVNETVYDEYVLHIYGQRGATQTGLDHLSLIKTQGT